MVNSRSLLLLALTALVILAPFPSDAESLYNPNEAQPLNEKQRTLFGPKSGQFRYDARMIKAAEIAAQRARRASTSRCWRYVKGALLAANVIDSYPKTAYAKQAGNELARDYGFKEIRVKDPYAAPLGAVIVYGGRGAGHVEIRTRTGFVSDFASAKPSSRPMIGVYVKDRG